MTTGYEVGMYRDIHQIAQALNRIANCLEAEEKRKRTQEATTPEELEQAMAAVAAVTRGFRDLEQAAQEQKEGTQ